MDSYLSYKTPKKLIQLRKLLEKCFTKPVLLTHNRPFLELYKTMLEDETRCEKEKLERTH